MTSTEGGKLFGLIAIGVAALPGCEASEAACEVPGTICAVAGSGQSGFRDADDPLSAELSLPLDVGFDAEGRLYIVDFNNHSIRRLEAGRLETVVGTGEQGLEALPGEAGATSVALRYPTDLGPAPGGGLLVSNWMGSVVGRYDPAGETFSVIAGDGRRAYCGDGLAATEASFDRPVGTSIDSAGRVHIMDMGAGRVRRIDHDGTVRQVAGPEVTDGEVDACFAEGGFDAPFVRFGYAGDGGPAVGSYLHPPWGAGAFPGGKLAIGPGDFLYVADTMNQRVRVVYLGREEIGQDPIVKTVAGSGGQECVPDTEPCAPVAGAYAGDGSLAIWARLNRPSDVAVAADGSIYIADTFNHCVRRVDREGFITTVAGVCGRAGDAGDGGPAVDALLERPFGVALDDEGNLFIADTLNHRVRVVRAPGTALILP